MENLTLILNILTVAVGLGFVIFLHELGHFLLAKWNDVKVEKFSIGFGPSLIRFHRGETEYALALFPLGGFVKMLGESPEEAESTSSDPRAYHNKSVGARMQIISAGVIMNLILGLSCFVFVFAWGGLLETKARIGVVVAGLPAYQAGFRTGDEIVAIDGHRGVDFHRLLSSIVLSAEGQVLHMEVKRPGQTTPITLSVEPRREAAREKPTIGINPSYDITLVPKHPFLAPPGMENPPADPDAGFQGEDRIVAVGPTGETPEPVVDVHELYNLLAKYRDKPLAFVVERKSKARKSEGSTPEKVTVTLPPVHFMDFGFRLALGPIVALQGGAIAEKAGFHVGDRIVKVDGKDDFDPMKLPEYCFDHAGKPVEFEIERTQADHTTQTINLSVTPDATPAWSEPVDGDEPLEIPGLGLACSIPPKIVAVREGSSAAKAGLKPGDVLSTMTLTLPNDKKAEKPEGLLARVAHYIRSFFKSDKPETLEFEFAGPPKKRASWTHAFWVLQAPADANFPRAPELTVKLTIEGSKTPISLAPEPDPTWFFPLRGLRQDASMFPLPPMSIGGAFKRGGEETVENVIAIYYMFRSLGQGRVSGKMIGGPIRIASMAYYFVSSGLAPFIYFLGMLSVNLTVLNFLPIPPLDGGQMAFLVAEKVRGKPLPDSALILCQYAGLALVLGLMLFFIGQDVLLTWFW